MELSHLIEKLKTMGYDVVQKIGQGGCGVCYKVFSTKYQSFFACKVILLNERKKELQEKSFVNELDALKAITHPYIIKVFDTFRTENELYFILEYCPNHDLQFRVEKEGPLQTAQLLEYAQMILDALLFLEENNISHNDIKPSNILIDQYGRPKLADFGLSKKLTTGELSKDFAGTPAYLAPEILHRHSYDPIKADIWSFGMTLYYLATGEFPYSTSSAEGLFNFSLTGFCDVPRTIDPIIRFIIQKTLVVDPDARMSFKDLKEQIQKKTKVMHVLSAHSLPPLRPRKQMGSRLMSNSSFKSFRLKAKSHTPSLKLAPLPA